MRRIIATIEARLASTRLPGKVMLPILGKPMLERMVERLRGSYLITDIVIATVEGCYEIIDLAMNIGVGWWGGPEYDLLSRVLGAARCFDADIIVELTGDCPLIDPAMVDKVIADYLLGGADFVANNLEYTAPRGFDVRVFSTEALARVGALTQDAADREHVSLYMWEHPDEFTCRNVRTEGIDPRLYRLTVDTQADYDVICKIFEALYPTKPDFTLFDVIRYLDAHPEVARLNAHVRQKAVR